MYVHARTIGAFLVLLLAISLTSGQSQKFKNLNVLKRAVRTYVKDPSSYTGGDIGEWDVSAMTTMKGLFQGIKEEMDLDLSTWDVSNVKDMSYMFQNTKLILDETDFATVRVRFPSFIQHLSPSLSL